MIIAGDGIVATALSQHYPASAAAGAQLADKVPGVHRYVAVGAWVISPDQLDVMDTDQPKFMDHENMMYLAIGCWDCEEPWSTETAATPCPAAGVD